jgi:hypothetical protein
LVWTSPLQRDIKHNTPRVRQAYEVFNQHCWSAAGPPTPTFTAFERDGSLYFGVKGSHSKAQLERIIECMKDHGIVGGKAIPPDA